MRIQKQKEKKKKRINTNLFEYIFKQKRTNSHFYLTPFSIFFLRFQNEMKRKK
jgi:hypothetical protein